MVSDRHRKLGAWQLNRLGGDRAIRFNDPAAPDRAFSFPDFVAKRREIARGLTERSEGKGATLRDPPRRPLAGAVVTPAEPKAGSSGRAACKPCAPRSFEATRRHQTAAQAPPIHPQTTRAPSSSAFGPVALRSRGLPARSRKLRCLQRPAVCRVRHTLTVVDVICLRKMATRGSRPHRTRCWRFRAHWCAMWRSGLNLRRCRDRLVLACEHLAGNADEAGAVGAGGLAVHARPRGHNRVPGPADERARGLAAHAGRVGVGRESPLAWSSTSWCESRQEA